MKDGAADCSPRQTRWYITSALSPYPLYIHLASIRDVNGMYRSFDTQMTKMELNHPPFTDTAIIVWTTQPLYSSWGPYSSFISVINNQILRGARSLVFILLGTTVRAS